AAAGTTTTSLPARFCPPAPRTPPATTSSTAMPSACWGSRHDLFNDLAVDVGEAVVAALEAEGEALVVYAEQMQHRRVQIVDVNAILHNVVPEWACLAVHGSGFDATAGHPDAEAPRMVIAAVVGRRQLPL